MSSPHPLAEYLDWLQATVGSYYSVLSNKDQALAFFKKAPEAYFMWLANEFKTNPFHVIIETGLIGFIFWLVLIRKTADLKRSGSQKTDDFVFQARFKDFQAKMEGLVPGLTHAQKAILDNFHQIESVDKEGKYMTLTGVNKPVLNVSGFDCYGMGSNAEVKAAAKDALTKYGCGSCGPRGFYGTIDTHLQFETEIAEFLGGEEAISYSDGASSITSAIPAFSKKGDLLVIDESCNESIFAGANLSRSTVVTFKHNDMDDLEAKLRQIAEDDRKKNRNATEQRRFIVVEGLYRNTGSVVDLHEVLALKNKYCYRIILDETLSFGTMGEHGRGVAEHFNISLDDIDIVNIAMDTSLGSIGGVCVGPREVVDHQRLSGAGYCFSASAPPFLSSAASKSLHFIRTNKNNILQKLKENSDTLFSTVGDVCRTTRTKGKSPALVQVNANADVKMHVQYVAFEEDASLSREQEEALISALERECVVRGLGVSSCKYAFSNKSLRPSIRLTASTMLNKSDFKHIQDVLTEAWFATVSARK